MRFRCASTAIARLSCDWIGLAWQERVCRCHESAPDSLIVGLGRVLSGVTAQRIPALRRLGYRTPHPPSREGGILSFKRYVVEFRVGQNAALQKFGNVCGWRPKPPTNVKTTSSPLDDRVPQYPKSTCLSSPVLLRGIDQELRALSTIKRAPDRVVGLKVTCARMVRRSSFFRLIPRHS